MFQKAVVKKVIDARHAEIEVQRQGACSHDCEKCGGCGTPTERIRATAINQAGAEPGDIVTVEGSSKQILGMAAIVYAIPIILFFALYAVCAALGVSEGLSILAGIAGFVIGILLAIGHNRRVKQSGKIVFTIVKKG